MGCNLIQLQKLTSPFVSASWGDSRSAARYIWHRTAAARRKQTANE